MAGGWFDWVAMALWLVCCVLLFVTSRGYSWLSHQSWFLAPELALPWLILGGVGLAIASNRTDFSKSPQAVSQQPMMPPQSSVGGVPGSPRPRSAIAPSKVPSIPTTPPAPAPAQAHSPVPSQGRQAESAARGTVQQGKVQRRSISFEVRRSQRRSPTTESE